MEDQSYRQKYIKYKSKYNGLKHNMSGGALPEQYSMENLRQRLPGYVEPINQKAVEIGQVAKEWINKSKFNIGEKLQTTSGNVTEVQNKVYDFGKGKWNYVITNVEGRLQNIDEDALENLSQQVRGRVTDLKAQAIALPDQVREQIPQLQARAAALPDQVREQLPQLQTKAAEWKQGLQARVPEFQARAAEWKQGLQARVPEIQTKAAEWKQGIQARVPEIQTKAAEWKQGLQARVPEIQARAAEFKGSLQARAPELQTKIQEQLSVLQGRIAELSTSLPDKNRIQTELADLKNKLPSLSAEEIQEKLIHLHEHLIDLQEQAKSQGSIWAERVQAKSGEVSQQVKERLSNLQNRLIELRTKLPVISKEQIQSELTQLQGHLSELSGKIDVSGIQAKVAEIRDRVSTMSSADIQARLSQLQERLVELKNKLPSMGEVKSRLSEKISDAQIRERLSDVKETLSLKSDELKEIMNRYN